MSGPWRSRARRATRFLLAWVLPALVLAGFAAYLWRRRSEFADIVDLSVLQIALIAVAILGTWLSNATQNWVLYRSEGIRIGFWENYLLFLGSVFGNYLPARIGTLFKLRYLKAFHGARYARQGGYFGFNLALVCLLAGILGVIGTIGIAASADVGVHWTLVVGFAAMAALSLAAWFVPVPEHRAGSGLVRRSLRDVAEGVSLLRTRPRVAAIYGALVLVQFGFLCTRIAVAYSAIGLHASIWLLLLLGPALLAVNLLAFTPGALGLREAIVGMITLAVGDTFDEGVFAATVDRTILLAMVAVVGGTGFVWTALRLRTTEPGDEPLTARDDLEASPA